MFIFVVGDIWKKEKRLNLMVVSQKPSLFARLMGIAAPVVPNKTGTGTSRSSLSQSADDVPDHGTGRRASHRRASQYNVR